MNRKVMQKVILAACLFISLLSVGQSNNSAVNKEWRVEMGYSNFRTLDKNVSPLIYIAQNGFIGGRFQKEQAQQQWNLEATVSIGTNQSKQFGKRELTLYDPYSLNGERDSSVYILNPGLSFIQGTLAYTHYWKLNASFADMHIGARVNDNFIYGALGGDVWFLNQLSISPSYKVRLLTYSKFKIDGEISVPIFSYNVRQPYTLDPSLPENSYFKANLKTGSQVVTLNEFQQANIKVDGSYNLKNGKSIGLTYRFMWMNYSNIPDRNLKAYSHTLSIYYTL